MRLESPVGGDVPVPVGSQVPLAHHVRGEVEAGVEVLGEEPELERQGVRLGRQNYAVLKPCKPVETWSGLVPRWEVKCWRGSVYRLSQQPAAISKQENQQTDHFPSR